ncbi:unnamed protein product, partial [Rotaria sp. Silwood2]
MVLEETKLWFGNLFK